jgi:hypothetical protein
MTKTIADCLVLKIEEYTNNSLDTTLFILYDKNEEQYLIRGKRSDILDKTVPISYAFSCKYASELFNFIDFLLCKKSKLNYTLYNYDNLPYIQSEIDYCYLKNLDGDVEYELSGYDNQKKSKKQIMKYLSILKNVFNYY